jgi:hypothetical protein
MTEAAVLIPETVTIPTRVLIDAVADIYAVEDLLLDLTETDTYVTGTLADVTAALLAAAEPDAEHEGRYDSGGAIVVEASARSKEVLAGWRDRSRSAADLRAEAAEIREAQHPFGFAGADQDRREREEAKV